MVIISDQSHGQGPRGQNLRTGDGEIKIGINKINPQKINNVQKIEIIKVLIGKLRD